MKIKQADMINICRSIIEHVFEHLAIDNLNNDISLRVESVPPLNDNKNLSFKVKIYFHQYFIGACYIDQDTQTSGFQLSFVPVCTAFGWSGSVCFSLDIKDSDTIMDNIEEIMNESDWDALEKELSKMLQLVQNDMKEIEKAELVKAEILKKCPNSDIRISRVAPTVLGDDWALKVEFCDIPSVVRITNTHVNFDDNISWCSLDEQMAVLTTIPTIMKNIHEK